ncbi:MAG: NAD(P)/FAD-dependent oxidoreductase [Candidatus Aenigmatarchaeota archaeon]|nr:MAG: NAD(P)/FAD-dependent oxidoreductase [Candidatus Aenigmarchaeota archaeon]
MHDLAIIGAGPAGSYLAGLCAGNRNVLVLEEHPEPGGKACSGLVSSRLIKLLPVEIKKKGLIEHTVKRAVMHFMNRQFEFKKRESAAYVIDRDVLDRRLAAYAESAGAEMRYREKVLSLAQDKEKVRLKTARRRFEAKIVAGCDGARSVAAKSIGSKPAELLNGLIMYIDKQDYSDTVEMWFDKSLVKDGFFWRIPRGKNTELGCMGYGLSFAILERFFDTVKMKVSGRAAAPVPLGITPTFDNRILLVGDAACQVKPWSGGGITYGMLSASYAAEVISNVLKRGGFTGLSAYEEMWKKRLLKDIKAGLIAREFYKDLDLKGLSSVIEKAESMKHDGDKIDFDFPFSSMFTG